MRLALWLLITVLAVTEQTRLKKHHRSKPLRKVKSLRGVEATPTPATLTYEIKADVYIHGQMTNCPPFTKLMCREDYSDCPTAYCADVINNNTGICKRKRPLHCFDNMVCECDPHSNFYRDHSVTELKCIKEEECAKKCGKNERLLCQEDCIDYSCHLKIDDMSSKVYCGKYTHTAANGKYCRGNTKPVCRCLQGYMRNSYGNCVPSRPCLDCGKNTREVCPGSCRDHSCYDVWQATDNESCHRYEIISDKDKLETCAGNEKVVCRCQSGYSRDEYGKCRRYQECPTYWSENFNGQSFTSLDKTYLKTDTTDPSRALYVGRAYSGKFQNFFPTPGAILFIKPENSYGGLHILIGPNDIDHAVYNVVGSVSALRLRPSANGTIKWETMNKGDDPPAKALRAGVKYSSTNKEEAFVYIGKTKKFLGAIIDGALYSCIGTDRANGELKSFQILKLDINYDD